MEHFQAIQVCKDMLQLVGRAFYDERELIVLDILQQNDSIRDDQLASALGINIKELQKICGKLKGMIQSTARWEELSKSDIVRKEFKERRKINRTYYYIDYARAVNAIKLKIFKIGKLIDKEVNQTVTETNLYKCPTCSKGFSALDMLTLEMTAEQIPICDVCLSELELDEQKEYQSSNTKYVKFMNESKPIVDLLKKTDGLVIPESDPRLPDLTAPTTEIQIKTEDTVSPAIPTTTVVVEIQKEEKQETSTNGISYLLDLQDYYASMVQTPSVSTLLIPQYLCFIRKRSAESESDQDEEFEEV